MMRRVLGLFLVGSAIAVAAPMGCVGSFSITGFRLLVQPAGSAASAALPLLQANSVPSGARISYRPLDLPGDMKKDAKLTLVLVPELPDGPVTVLEPKLAASPGEWQAPFAARIVLVVFAPQGLDEKRLTNLVTRDAALVATLADYADETADLESQIETARLIEQETEELDAARPYSPAEQALFAMMRSLNPAVSGYDPLGAGRRIGPTTLVGKSAEEFLNNAGGMVPYGGILPMVRPWLLPDTEVRSVYAIPDESDGMRLCTKVQLKGKNKLAYLWAYRLAQGSAPKIPLTKDLDVPLGMRVTVPLKLEDPAEWRPVSRIYSWTLVPETGSVKPLSITVRAAPEERTLHLDLRKFAGAPGSYRIQGRWDWDTVKGNGTLRLHSLDDFTTARLTPESQDQLISGTGPASIDLAGADFMFVDRARLHRASNPRQLPADLPPVRVAPSNRLRIEIDTDGLRAGPYLLALARVDGQVTDLPIRLLPPPPRLDTTGSRVNVGDREAHLTLTGSGLDRIERLEAERADIVLEAASENGTRRGVFIKLHVDAKPGDKLALAAKVEGMAGPLRFPGVLQVTAARPRILEARASAAPDLAVSTRDGEIPAGSWVSYAVRVEPPGTGASLTLQCAETTLAVQPVRLRVGEKQASAQLTPAGDGGWFLSFDPGAAGQSGCTLTAVMETEDLGKSDPFTLGKVVRLPRIESFAMTDDKSPDGFYGVLKGYDLDTIAKTGWDSSGGVVSAELPRPLAGEGSRQTLRIAMPWPSPTPKAPLFVWLRGEADGRATKVSP